MQVNVFQGSIASYGVRMLGIDQAMSWKKAIICQPAAIMLARMVITATGAGMSCEVFFIVFL